MPDKRAVNLEIKRLADFRSLKITRYAMIFFLLVNFMSAILYNAGPYSIYILAMALVLPPAISIVAKNGITVKSGSKKEKTEKEYHLSCLIMHYHFSFDKYLGENISFYILIAICMLWQKRYNSTPSAIIWYNYYPACLMAFCVVIRLILYVFYRIFLPYRVIKHNY